MNVYDAEKLIQELATEVRMNSNTDDDNFSKPIYLSRVGNLLIYIAKLKEEIENRKKFEESSRSDSKKIGYMLEKFYQIRDSKFPDASTKSDLLQEMAAKTIETVYKM